MFEPGTVECSLKFAIQMARDHVRLTPDVDAQLSYTGSIIYNRPSR